MVERWLRESEVAGSNPVTPIMVCPSTHVPLAESPGLYDTEYAFGVR